MEQLCNERIKGNKHLVWGAARGEQLRRERRHAADGLEVVPAQQYKGFYIQTMKA